MADEKPECVHTCKAVECVPIVENDERWNDFHMPCWICTADPKDERRDLMWHEESEMYFHRLCILTRAREQALEVADRDDSTFRDCAALFIAGSLLRSHRRRIRA